jgi:Asp-tRNA(Asn)/Glu-tRNA(Gln) amidotransferase A subunit family amidase
MLHDLPACQASGQAVAGADEETTDSLRGGAEANEWLSIRPPFGRVPLKGMVPLALDRHVAGSPARKGEDAAMSLNVTPGGPERSQTCAVAAPCPLWRLQPEVPNARTGKARLPRGTRQCAFNRTLLSVFASAVTLREAMP